MKYIDFIKSKARQSRDIGFEDAQVSDVLFDFQRDVVRWAVRKGRAAIFQDCGMGKTLQQIEFARVILEKIGGSGIIFTPLAVAQQTIREGKKIGVSINLCKTGDDVIPGLNVTNYERLNHFSPDQFSVVVLDESSILKSFSGKTRQEIQAFSERIMYRLACTATPAPNDYMELGNHSEYLGVMRRVEMLAEYFVHDASDTQKWRLKGHAEKDFWKWMASWCVAMRRPSDIGFDDGAFILPALNIHHKIVESKSLNGYLFPTIAQTLEERRDARRSSLSERVAAAADLANNTTDPFLIWCDLNIESDALKRAIPGAVEIKGSDSQEHKESSMMGFSDGSIRVLITKPSIAGFGMNWQHCNKMAFVGLSDSYEQIYQATRRCWRFGQKKIVDCWIIASESEGAVIQNIARKERQSSEMFDQLVKHISVYGVGKRPGSYKEYEARNKIKMPSWLKENASCL